MPRGPIDRELERSGRRLGNSGGWFLLLAVLLAVPGVALLVVGGGAVEAVGLALTAFSLAPALVGAGLLLAGFVSRHSARHRPFA